MTSNRNIDSRIEWKWNYIKQSYIVLNSCCEIKCEKNKFSISDFMFYSVEILTRLKQLSLLFETLKIQWLAKKSICTPLYYYNIYILINQVSLSYDLINLILWIMKLHMILLIKLKFDTMEIQDLKDILLKNKVECK